MQPCSGVNQCCAWSFCFLPICTFNERWKKINFVFFRKQFQIQFHRLRDHADNIQQHKSEQSRWRDKLVQLFTGTKWPWNIPGAVTWTRDKNIWIPKCFSEAGVSQMCDCKLLLKFSQLKDSMVLESQMFHFAKLAVLHCWKIN